MVNRKGLFVFMVDVALVALSYVMSFLFRFDFDLPEIMPDYFYAGLCIALLIKPLVFLATGFYRNLWRYASLTDATKIIKAVSLSSLLAAFVILFSRYPGHFPRSIIILDWMLLLALVSASRLSWRLYRETRTAMRRFPGKKTLIIGAGEAGSFLLKEIMLQPNSPFAIVGFVDDDDSKQGMYLNGVRVLGKVAQLPDIVRSVGAEEVVIAMPSAKGKVLRSIVERCNRAGVRCKTIPRIGDIVDGKLSVSQIKDVEIGMLLGREAVVLDEAGIRIYLGGKRVLVSGAGGSIGSELSRQVARFGPAMLILVDNAETPLFYIERELRSLHPDLKIIPLLGDVCSREKIDRIFADFRPEAVFHAAAYKHVRMMEYNPAEAVLNNIAGTRIMADAADRYGTSDFVLISTDKAVNPTNVMGTSKRVAEIYVQALSARSATRFSTVRFGNVIGSNGSVIPLFMEQIRLGGPVTVTDPHVVRYFMTIPEAAQLVLQAGCIGRGGEIFVLDMGEPMRIKDLAEELIRLSGLIPYEDVDIVYTGLGPGEKLFEELVIAGEGIIPTIHDKIRIVAAVEADLDAVNLELARLFKLAGEADITGLMSSLRRLVREYSPNYTFDGPVPFSFQQARPDLFPRPRVAVVPAKILSLRDTNTGHFVTASGP